MEGDSTLQKRRDMFFERRAIVEKQMDAIQKTMDMIQYKCRYYETACEAGTGAVPSSISFDNLPEDAKKGKA